MSQPAPHPCWQSLGRRSTWAAGVTARWGKVARSRDRLAQWQLVRPQGPPTGIASRPRCQQQPAALGESAPRTARPPYHPHCKVPMPTKPTHPAITNNAPRPHTSPHNTHESIHLTPLTTNQPHHALTLQQVVQTHTLPHLAPISHPQPTNPNPHSPSSRSSSPSSPFFSFLPFFSPSLRARSRCNACSASRPP